MPIDGYTLARSSSLVAAAVVLSLLIGDGQAGSVCLASTRATVTTSQKSTYSALAEEIY